MTGDQLNKKIAMDFLATLQKQQQKESNDGIEQHSSSDGNDDGSDKKHMYQYKTPVRTGSESTTTTSTNHFQSSHGGKALVMDTFEFGSKKTVKKDMKRKSALESNEPGTMKINNTPLSCDFNDDVEEKDGDISTMPPSDGKVVQTNMFKSRKKNKVSYRKRGVDNSLLPETIDEEEEE